MSRLMLLPFVALPAWIGTAYLLGAPARTSSDAFTSAKSLAPIELWGVMFLLGALTLGVAAATRRRSLIALGLFVGGAIYCWWGTLFAVSALNESSASLNGGAVYLFIAAVHFVGFHRTRVTA